jgi:predicted Zn-dependent protease
MARQVFVSFSIAAALVACQSAPVAPHAAMPERGQLSREESGLWRDAEDFDRRLEKSDAIFADAEATRYVQRVMDRLYPEFQGRIRVRLLRTPTLNAFALPNGSIYMHVGLLARLENEAQLATVLAHEGVHFTHRHSLQQHESVKLTSGILQATLIAAPVAGLVGATVAAPVLYGYSRDFEREADAVGFERLVRAGYEPSEAPRTFEHLANEVKAHQIVEPMIYASHPKLIERIENFSQLIGTARSGGETGVDAFRSVTRGAKLVALEGDLARRRYRSVILVLESETSRRRYPPEAQYFLGEAYRQRGEAGDGALAERAYLAATEATPRYAPPYRALGVLSMKRQDYRSAKSHFERYLELAPNAPDRAYVESYRMQALGEAQQ